MIDPMTVISVGSSLLGGLFGNKSAKKAAEAQARAAEQQRLLYEQQTQPYREFGQGSLTSLSGLLGLNGQAPSYDLSANPAYQFRLGQGIKALDSSAAARGNLLSGGQLKAISDYGQQSASQEYDSVLSRLFQGAAMGQNAAMGYAAGASGAIGSAGDARAAGIVGGANAINSGISNATLWSLLSQGQGGVQQPPPPAAPVAGGYQWAGAAKPAAYGPSQPIKWY